MSFKPVKEYNEYTRPDASTKEEDDSRILILAATDLKLNVRRDAEEHKQTNIVDLCSSSSSKSKDRKPLKIFKTHE